MNLYAMLQNKIPIQDIEKNISLFHTLSDIEINKIMKDDTIDFAYKELLVNIGADRMIRLSNHEWVYPLIFLYR